MSSAFLIPDLERDEGLKLRAYPDPRSPLAVAIHEGRPTGGLSGAPWTVGDGCTGPDIGPNTVWTAEQARTAMIRRAQDFEAALSNALSWYRDINPLRQDVLVNMTYNMGLHGLLAFHNTLTLIQEGKYAAAAQAMLESAWAKQVGNRAVRLSRQMASGAHQALP